MVALFAAPPVRASLAGGWSQGASQQVPGSNACVAGNKVVVVPLLKKFLVLDPTTLRMKDVAIASKFEPACVVGNEVVVVSSLGKSSWYWTRRL